MAKGTDIAVSVEISSELAYCRGILGQLVVKWRKHQVFSECLRAAHNLQTARTAGSRGSPASHPDAATGSLAGGNNGISQCPCFERRARSLLASSYSGQSQNHQAKNAQRGLTRRVPLCLHGCELPLARPARS